MPHVQATAHVNGVTQTRSSAGQYNGFCQQGGLEVLERADFAHEGARVAAEALETLQALARGWHAAPETRDAAAAVRRLTRTNR